MITYKTFADCKLAHPNCPVYRNVYSGDFSPNLITPDFAKRNPADFLMSMEEFFNKGFKFEIGDAYIETDGSIEEIESNHDLLCASERNQGDYKRFVLKAAALESSPSHGIAAIQTASGHIESINDYPIEQVLRGLESEVKSVSGHPSSSAKLYKACLDMLDVIDGERLTQRAYGFYCEFHGDEAIDFDEWVQDDDQRAPWEFMVKRGGL